MENTPPPILGHNDILEPQIEHDPNTPKLKVANRNDAIFLIAFMGFTPFSILGVHDFILGQKKNGKAHLLIFGLITLLMMAMGVSPFVVSIFTHDHEAAEKLTSTIYQFTNAASIVLVGISYFIGVLEAISYIGNIDSYIKIVKPKDDLEDEDEDEEQSTEEIGDDPESKITP